MGGHPIERCKFDSTACGGRGSVAFAPEIPGSAPFRGLGGTGAERIRSGPRTIVLADKAYDADRIRELLQDQGATPNIPPKSNRKWKPCFSKRFYRERNLIERFFSKLKHVRRVATRFDKLAGNFPAMVQLTSIRLWLRAYESTTWVASNAHPHINRHDHGSGSPSADKAMPILG